MQNVDEVLREAVQTAGAALPEERRRAALLVLGWEGTAVPLVEAARVAGVSRETVRRDRDRIARLLAADPAVAQAATGVLSLLEGSGTTGVRELTDAARTNRLFVDTNALLPVIATLKAAGQLSDVRTRTSADGEDLLEVDTGTGAQNLLLDELADGVPRDLSARSDLASAVQDLRAGGRVHPLGTSRVFWAIGAESAPAAHRALARLLTMTGPLAWPDLLAAWSRAAAKPPHTPLPTWVDVLTDWVQLVPGVHVREDPVGTPAGADVSEPAELDRTSTFLLRTLSAEPAGMERAELLARAEQDGLRPSGLVAALSHHPALVSATRGRWALRPSSWATQEPQRASRASPAPKRRRPRPTTFTWSTTGELVLEFSVPAGPSPVIAVPSAVTSMLAQQRLVLSTPDGLQHGTLSVREARAWGFGSALRHLGAEAGQRAKLTCDLVAGAATASLT